MIPILKLSDDIGRQRVEFLLGRLRLDPCDVALNRGERAKAVAIVSAILADVAERGDAAVVESSRRFDDPDFSVGQIHVSEAEMRYAAARTPADQMAAVRRSIKQVKEYQVRILPQPPAPVTRDGVELGLRFTPLESAGLYFPGGKASYPSSLI